MLLKKNLIFCYIHLYDDELLLLLLPKFLLRFSLVAAAAVTTEFCQLLPSKCLGASAYVNFSRNASATKMPIWESVQLCVGRFCSNNISPCAYNLCNINIIPTKNICQLSLTWKSFSCSNWSRQCSKKAAQTYSWNNAKPSLSAKYVSHRRIVQCSGSSRVNKLFIHLNENCK